MVEDFAVEDEFSIAKRILGSHAVSEDTKLEIQDVLRHALSLSLKIPPTPQWLPYLTASTQRKIRQIQNYINEFEYNHTGQTFFKTKRNRGMKHLLYTAKFIMREALPIQCVEALFLGKE